MKLIPGASIGNSVGRRILTDEDSSLSALIQYDKDRYQQQQEEEKLRQQQQARDEFDKRQEDIKNGNIFSQTWNSAKALFGNADTLPEIEGAAPEYQKLREETLKARDDAKLSSVAKKKLEEMDAEKGNYLQELMQQGMTKEQADAKYNFDAVVGGVKNLGELASGTAKLATGLTPTTGFSTIRKLIKVVGGQEVSELMDRNTPEYLKAVDASIDETGILNYKPEYANVAQKNGGEVAEIGSWFIPITRLGKGEKIAEAVQAIPLMTKVLGVTPKIVKSGGKLFIEASKDAIDVATLDAIRGKSVEQIKEDAAMGFGGGLGLRVAGAPISKILEKGQQVRLTKTIEESLGKLSDDEKSFVSSMLEKKTPTDDILSTLANNREATGKPVFDGTPTKKPTVSNVEEKLPQQKPVEAPTSPVEQRKVESNTNTPQEPVSFNIEKKMEGKPTKTVLSEYQKDVQNYRKTGIGFEGDKQPMNASLLRLQEFSDLPAVKKDVQKITETAIKNGEIKLNEDGTITVYRAGDVPKDGRLTSVTYSKEYAQEFSKGEKKVQEFTIPKEDVKVFIGKDESELLVNSESLKKYVSGKKPSPQTAKNPTTTTTELPKQELPKTAKETPKKDMRERSAARTFSNKMKRIGKPAMDDIPTYEVQHRVDQYKMIEDAIKTDYQGLVAAVEKGESYKGINPVLALERLGRSKVEPGFLLNLVETTKLSERATESGQFNSAWAAFSDYNPFKRVKNIIDAHAGKTPKKVSAKTSEKLVEKAKKSMEFKIEDARDILKSLTCKL